MTSAESSIRRPPRIRWPIGLLLGLAACKHGGTAAAEEQTPAVVGARTAVAARQAFVRSLDAIGTVTSRSGHVAQLSAPAPARIARIFVTTGQAVARGAALVEFERAPFDAQARSAEIALSAAEQNQARAKRLADAGILPRKDVAQASTDLAQAEAAAISARRTQQLATLRAPISGVVTRLNATLGASVDPSQQIVEVSDPSALDILLTVMPAEAAQVHAGQAVELTAGQRAAGEAIGTGIVADVSATVDTASRGVVVRARLAKPRRPLRIGETVFGRISVARDTGVVIVPIEAVVPEGDGFKVFVLDSAHVAHATPVTVGARTDSVAEIREGLHGGETIVTYGAYGVSDSAKVTPLTPAAAAPSKARR